jgi:hypothetical protein
MCARVLFVGATGPVGLTSVPHLLAGGHEVALAHTGRHEPPVAWAECDDPWNRATRSSLTSAASSGFWG